MSSSLVTRHAIPQHKRSVILIICSANNMMRVQNGQREGSWGSKAENHVYCCTVKAMLLNNCVRQEGKVVVVFRKRTSPAF